MCILQCVWKQNRLETWDTVTWVADSKTSPIGRSPEPCRGRTERLRPTESGSSPGLPCSSPGAPDPWWSHWVRAPPRPAWGKVASPERKHNRVFEIGSSTSSHLILNICHPRPLLWRFHEHVELESCFGRECDSPFRLNVQDKGVVVHVGRGQAVNGLRQDGVAVQEVGPWHVHRVSCLSIEVIFGFRYQINCKYKQISIQSWWTVHSALHTLG